MKNSHRTLGGALALAAAFAVTAAYAAGPRQSVRHGCEIGAAREVRDREGRVLVEHGV